MKIWLRCGRLCLETANSSWAACTAAGAGDQRNHHPSCRQGKTVPDEPFRYPCRPCPEVYHSSGDNGTMAESGHQDWSHGMTGGYLSWAGKCKGRCNFMGSAAKTPSVRRPLDRPSVPWCIIRVPATCTTCKRREADISNFLRRKTK